MSSRIAHSVSLLLTLILVVFELVSCQWTQSGFDSAQSFSSPYNGNDQQMTGMCTMWTSNPVLYTGSQVSFTVLPLLQTLDQRYLIYQNALIHSHVFPILKRGTVAMQWDVLNSGYAVAYVPKSDQNTEMIISAMEIHGANGGNVGYRFSAFKFPTTIDPHGNFLDEKWSCDDLTALANFRVLLMEPAGLLLVDWVQDGTSIVAAIHLDNGTIAWKSGFASQSRKNMAASGNKVVVAYDGNVVAIDCFTGASIWNFGPEQPVDQLFTIVENQAVISMLQDKVYFLVGLDIGSGNVVWSQKSLSSIGTNGRIINVAQVKSMTESCTLELLVQNQNSLLTTCLDSTGKTTGLFWAEKNDSDDVSPVSLLSLGAGRRNVISTTASSDNTNHQILFYRTIGQKADMCRLSDHRWEVAIQDSTKMIYAVARSTENQDFRVIAFSTQKCLLFPQCPLFERSKTIKNWSIFGGVVGGLFLCCFSICCFCCCVQCGCFEHVKRIGRECRECCSSCCCCADDTDEFDRLISSSRKKKRSGRCPDCCPTGCNLHIDCANLFGCACCARLSTHHNHNVAESNVGAINPQYSNDDNASAPLFF